MERLLLSWCRLTTVKEGKVAQMKDLVEGDVRRADILQMIEKYENSIELALAFVGGLGFMVRMWQKQGMWDLFRLPWKWVISRYIRHA